MASVSVTYTFTNSTTADATQVTQNFQDIINGTSDGTKDFSIGALTCAGNATLNGNTAIGNATSDTLTITARLASSVSPSAHNTYDLGTVTTLGYRAMYFASSSATNTVKLQGPAISADVTQTLPSIAGNIALSTITIQTFTSGSNTYTTPSGVKYIRVRMCGGGGGGAGSGTTNGTAAGAGGNTTFGTSLLTANGGTGGVRGGDATTGGSASVAGSATQISALSGGYGGPGCASATQTPGGSGGSNPFGAAAGGGGNAGGVGQNAPTNSGGGGGGGLGPTTAGGVAGAGGGAGGYVDAVILPTAGQTFSTSVGAGGTNGGGGTSGLAGGNGGSGIILVMEYY